MKNESIAVVSIRLPASLYLALQRAARRHSVDEDRSVTGPAIIRELVQREFGANGWNQDMGRESLGVQ